MGRFLAAPLLLGVLSVGFFWKLVLTRQFTWVDHPDGVNQVMPWLQFQAAQWQQGRYPLWDPHQWAGQPLLGLVQPGALSPLNWLLFSLPLGEDGLLRVSTLNGYWVLIHFLAALFGYWMCRDQRLSRAASLVAGCAFGFGGTLGTTFWPHVVQSAIWLPLVLLFFLRVVEGRRPVANAALSGAFLGLLFLSGHHNVPIFATLGMAALWGYQLLAPPRPRGARAVLPCAAFFLCLGLIAAAQILPSVEFGRLSYRWVNLPEPVTWSQRVPYEVHARYSLGSTSLLGILLPHQHRGWSPFAGFVVLSLAFLGVATSWQQRPVRILGSLALGGLLFSLGSDSLYHGVLYALVPGLDKARTPAMANALLQLGLAGAAAWGVQRLSAPGGALAPWGRLVVRALVASGAFLFAALAILVTVRAETGEEYRSLALSALVALLLAGLLGSWLRSRISSQSAGVALVLLLLFELNLVTNDRYATIGRPGSGLSKLRENHDIAAFLRQRPEPVRVEVDAGEIPYNFGDWFGIDQLGGALGGLTQGITRIHGETRARMLLAANYHVGRGPIRPGQTEVFQGRSGLRVFRNEEAFPRVFAVHEAIARPDESSVLSAVVDPAIDLRRSVLLETRTPPLLERCEAPDEVRLSHSEPDRLAISARLGCTGMVILGDTWFPGWEATVDGEPAPIHKAYGVIRGVVVGPGEHEIRMQYRPGSVRLGAGLACLGLLACAAFQLPLPRRTGGAAQPGGPSIA